MYSFVILSFSKPLLLDGPRWVQLSDTEGSSEAFLIGTAISDRSQSITFVT